ncbi:MAG: hypothetical protein RLZ10_204 [Bacteroidota bacterium]|jgi:hypothetical protein
MKNISQILDTRNKESIHANYVYTIINKFDSKFTKNGFLISEFLLKDGRHYSVYLMSNLSPTKISSIVNLTSSEFNSMDEDLLEEFHLNGMDNYLKFDSEAYFHIICEEEPEEVKFIFTDYLEAVEYLELLEKGLL